ncbi:hypothetical protein [Marinomonas sp. CT5]|uniref:hypothetical protein n=1 Tax=Marinomonas sp. CT5 TaxID=2066133 RepID=UPI001BAECCBF|nr:hypothetical protein [Marinomonas sp. CT5]
MSLESAVNDFKINSEASTIMDKSKPVLFRVIRNQIMFKVITSLYLQCEQHNIDMYLKHNFDLIHQMIDKGVKKAMMVNFLNINKKGPSALLKL